MLSRLPAAASGELGVLIETTRREGFKLSISRPRVLFRGGPATSRRLEAIEGRGGAADPAADLEPRTGDRLYRRPRARSVISTTPSLLQIALSRRSSQRPAPCQCPAIVPTLSSPKPGNPELAARHGQADASVLGGCVYIRVVLFSQHITCVFDNRYTMSERCEMPTKSLPAAFLRIANRLPAGRIRLRVTNYLFCMVLWSIEQWFVGAESRFLPVLRETPGGRRGVAV
jgi:hypothetical protein